MKKLLALTLTVILAAALVLPVCAADADYDEAELKQLLTDAFRMHIEYDRDFGDFIYSTCVKLYDENDLSCKIVDHSYYAQRNGDHNTWEGFQTALKACVTESLAEEFVTALNIQNIDGYTYSQTVVAQAQNQGVWLEPTDMGSENFEHFDLDSTFKVVSATGDKIKAEFLLYFFSGEDRVKEYTVEYTKTDAGWRVSGGTFVEELMIRGLDCFDYAPQTSLTAVTYAIVAVAALGVVVVKKRKH